ncbi:MAG: D-glycero-alpha-D-manno-heptose-1,7-bisphosphate 7-phosphatase [Thermodesulfobacteriota bacterium]
MRRAVFFDRDGTLNEEREYLSSPEGLVVLEGAIKAVKIINDAALMTVIISNQSGVGRGYFRSEDVDAVNDRLSEIMEEGGGRIDAFYYCPHRPEEGCECRKPGTGLVERASRDLAIDPTRSYVIGDKASDMEMARRCGARGVLVLTGYGKEERERLSSPPDFVAGDVLEAVEWIVGDIANHPPDAGDR